MLQLGPKHRCSLKEQNPRYVSIFGTPAYDIVKIPNIHETRLFVVSVF